MSARQRPNEDGFTLLELLISVALLGMLSLLLFAGLSFGTRAWESAQTSESLMTKVIVAQHALSERIASAYPLFVRVSPQEGHVAFAGTPHRLSFLAPAPAGGMEEVTVGTVPSRGHLALAIWTKPELSVSGTAGRPMRLLDGIDELDIAYFGGLSPRDDPAWHDDWENAISMPVLVRIRVKPSDPHLHWPELTIAPHVEVDQGCVFDQLTHYCQGRT